MIATASPIPMSLRIIQVPFGPLPVNPWHGATEPTSTPQPRWWVVGQHWGNHRRCEAAPVLGYEDPKQPPTIEQIEAARDDENGWALWYYPERPALIWARWQGESKELYRAHTKRR